MKKKEKQMIGILILITVIIITVIWFATRTQTEENVQNAGSQTSPAQGEYTKVEQDGTIVNTSEKLNENKETSGFEITNIRFKEVNGETILSARVTNKTGKQQQTFLGNIVLLDKSGNEMGRIPVRISTIEAGESRDIEATINASYANAYDFKLEK